MQMLDKKRLIRRFLEIYTIHTDDRNQGNTREKGTPFNATETIFDSVHRARSATQDKELDVVDD
jgi:hypothetical protein